MNKQIYLGALRQFREKLALVCSPPDTTTPEGRSRFRYRQAAITSLSLMAARVINIITSLVTVPLTLGYLGSDRYGLWMALTSAFVFLNHADMGIGTGLQNRLAACYGQDDQERPRELVSTALLMLSGIFALVALLAFFVLPWLALDRLIHVETSSARDELLPTAQTILVIVGMSFPLGAIQRICNGYQKGYLSALWMASGRLLSLAALLVVIYLEGPLPMLVAAMMLPPVVMMGLGAGSQMLRQQPWLMPSLSKVRLRALKEVLHIGAGAFVTQLGWILVINAPALIIANQFNTEAVTPYAVTQRLVGTSTIFLGAVLQPLWPAYSEALARYDSGWVQRTLLRSLKFAVVIQGAVFLMLTMLGQWVIHLWAGEQAVPSFGLLMAVNLYFFVTSVDLCFHSLLMAASRFRSFILALFVAGAPAILLGFGFAQQVGVAALVWIFALVAFVPRLILMAVDSQLLLKRLAREAPSGIEKGSAQTT